MMDMQVHIKTSMHTNLNMKFKHEILISLLLEMV